MQLLVIYVTLGKNRLTNSSLSGKNLWLLELFGGFRFFGNCAEIDFYYSEIDFFMCVI